MNTWSAPLGCGARRFHPDAPRSWILGTSPMMTFFNNFNELIE